MSTHKHALIVALMIFLLFAISFFFSAMQTVAKKDAVLFVTISEPDPSYVSDGNPVRVSAQIECQVANCKNVIISTVSGGAEIQGDKEIYLEELPADTERSISWVGMTPKGSFMVKASADNAKPVSAKIRLN